MGTANFKTVRLGFNIDLDHQFRERNMESFQREVATSSRPMIAEHRQRKLDTYTVSEILGVLVRDRLFKLARCFGTKGDLKLIGLDFNHEGLWCHFLFHIDDEPSVSVCEWEIDCAVVELLDKIGTLVSGATFTRGSMTISNNDNRDLELGFDRLI